MGYKSIAYRIVLAQLGVALVLAAVCLAAWGRSTAVAALVGGGFYRYRTRLTDVRRVSSIKGAYMLIDTMVIDPVGGRLLLLLRALPINGSTDEARLSTLRFRNR